MTDTALPVTPYAGTSGYSGSDTSMERAVREDSDGTTRDRQAATLASLRARHADGLTYRELGLAHGWHHGQSSGVLSTLHKEGLVARLTERRNRCAVYVLPEYVGGRETAAQGRQQQHEEARPIDVVLAEWLDRDASRWNKAMRDPAGFVKAAMEATGRG